MKTVSIKFVLKIKANHNPPTFNANLGKGVLYQEVIDIKVDKSETLSDVQLAIFINKHRQDLINEWIEVAYEEVS